MPAPGQGGVQTPINPIVTYSWGYVPGPGKPGARARGQDITQFRDTFNPDGGYFSPNYPLVPPDYEPVRGWNFPVGYNAIWTPRSFEPVGFRELRALAESHDITRLAIETRKDQIEKLEWQIKPRDDENPNDDVSARADKMHEFWERPDGEQDFSTWLRKALEDVLVIDAPCFEIRRTRGGQIIGLDNVDGSTMKLLLDYKARRPIPPAPAFQQVIHGRPWRLLTSDDLLYMPRNVRPHKLYGFSPVEQIITTVNIGLRRQIMQLKHFTEGNVPPGLLNAPDGWNADQIARYQAWFDSQLQGNLGAKTRLLWGPVGAKYQAFKEAPYKDDFDEWIARIVCFAFSLPPTAFTKTQNRGEQEATKEAALEEGLAPLMAWVKRLVDYVIQVLMGQHDIEFAWKDDVKQTSPVEQMQIVTQAIKEGVYTRNEGRDVLGMDPIEGADELMVDTGQGPVLVRMIADQAEMAMQQQKQQMDQQAQSTSQGAESHAMSMEHQQVDLDHKKNPPEGENAGNHQGAPSGGAGEKSAAARAARALVDAEATFRLACDRAARSGKNRKRIAA